MKRVPGAIMRCQEEDNNAKTMQAPSKESELTIIAKTLLMKLWNHDYDANIVATTDGYN